MPTWLTLLDALDEISSFTSHALYAVNTGILSVSALTGLRPELIAAGVCGFFIFVGVLKFGLAAK